VPPHGAPCAPARGKTPARQAQRAERVSRGWFGRRRSSGGLFGVLATT
jgi:hypothetical protein